VGLRPHRCQAEENVASRDEDLVPARVLDLFPELGSDGAFIKLGAVSKGANGQGVSKKWACIST
jgi:hypothetical protein